MLTIKIEKDYASSVKEMNLDVPEDAIVMTMKDSSILMGLGVMRIFKEYAVIDDIRIKEEFEDFSLEYGLGKSLLNVIDLRGVRHVVSFNPDIEKQLRALRFRPVSEVENAGDIPQNVKNCNLYLDLDGYFLANC